MRRGEVSPPYGVRFVGADDSVRPKGGGVRGPRPTEYMEGFKKIRRAAPACAADVVRGDSGGTHRSRPTKIFDRSVGCDDSMHRAAGDRKGRPYEINFFT